MHSIFLRPSWHQSLDFVCPWTGARPVVVDHRDVAQHPVHERDRAVWPRVVGVLKRVVHLVDEHGNGGVIFVEHQFDHGLAFLHRLGLRVVVLVADGPPA